MQVIQPRLQSWGELYPNQLDGLALWLDAIDQNSLLASDGSVIEDGEAVALWSDKSGNSAENCLVLNGVSGNYASTPDSAELDVTWDVDLRVKCQFANWSSGTYTLLSKRLQIGNQISYDLSIVNGALAGRWSSNGAVNAGESATSSANVAFSSFATGWVRATRASASGDVIFYTSTDGFNWSQLGATQATNAGSIYSSTSRVEVGSHTNGTGNPTNGIIYEAQIYASTDGTDLRFDADFTAQAKLATSFTESSSNAATVTINTTGATRARISGARDLYQGTVANRPLYSVSERSVTTDGTNDYMKGLAFSQGQPVTIYAAMQQVTWTSGDYLFDGNTNDTLALIQTTSTPQLNISAGSIVAANTGLAVATKGVVSAIYNGASSSLRINRETATTGNAGAGTANGLTIGSKADGSAAGNGKYYEILVYSGAHDTATRDRITQYLGRKWGIAV